MVQVQRYIDVKNQIKHFVFENILLEDVKSTLVTASQAVFVVSKENNKKKAAAAVVGYQFKHSALQELFTNITKQVSSFQQFNLYKMQTYIYVYVRRHYVCVLFIIVYIIYITCFSK